jgi:hypothetical protein
MKINSISPGLYRIEDGPLFIARHHRNQWLVINVETEEYSNYFSSLLEAKTEGGKALGGAPLIHDMNHSEVAEFLIPSIKSWISSEFMT